MVNRLPSGLGAFTLPLPANGVWHLWRQGGGRPDLFGVAVAV